MVNQIEKKVGQNDRDFTQVYNSLNGINRKTDTVSVIMADQIESFPASAAVNTTVANLFDPQYGEFYVTVSASLATVTAFQAVTGFLSASPAVGVGVSGTNLFTFSATGKYLLTYSSQHYNTGGNGQGFTRAKLNTTEIVGSWTTVCTSIANDSGTCGTSVIVNITSTTDTIGFEWCGINTSQRLGSAHATGASPTTQSCFQVTITKIGN